MAEEADVGARIERLFESGMNWRQKAERFETALMLIASYQGKTLIRHPQDPSYSQGAANAFEQLASLADAALQSFPPQEKQRLGDE